MSSNKRKNKKEKNKKKTDNEKNIIIENFDEDYDDRIVKCTICNHECKYNECGYTSMYECDTCLNFFCDECKPYSKQYNKCLVDDCYYCRHG